MISAKPKGGFGAAPLRARVDSPAGTAESVRPAVSRPEEVGLSRWERSRFTLPVASGLLLALAYLGIPPILPNLVAFLPILRWLDANSDAPRGERLRAGLLFGAVTYLVILYWMYSMLEYSWLAVVLYVALVPAFAVVVMLAINLAAWLRRDAGWPWAISLPACWIALEWAHSFTDLRMTADLLGHTLAAWPFVVQFADLVGPYGVGAAMLAANGLLYEALRSRGEPAGRRSAIALVALLAAVLAYDSWAWSHPPIAERTVRVGIVQPNIPLDVKHGQGTEEEQWKTLSDQSRDAASRGAEIVVWPETARPWPLQHWLSEPRSFALPEIQGLARETGAEVIAGVEYYRISDPKTIAFYNAALLVHRDGRMDPAWSAKIYLVPFVEGVPFERLLGPVLSGHGGEMKWLGGGFTPGPGAVVLPAGGTRIGTLICYEELYPDLARRLRNAGAEIIAIMTNDAWFGRTVFQVYQANSVRLRAIENRCSFVRVANTGISGFVDPLGRYRGWTEMFVPAVEVEDVPVSSTRTLYGRVGDVAAWLAVGAAAVGMLVALRARGRRGGPAGGADELGDGRHDVGEVPESGSVGG